MTTIKVDFRDSDGNWTFGQEVSVNVRDGCVFPANHESLGAFEIDKADDGRINLRCGGAWRYVAMPSDLSQIGVDLSALA